MSSSIRLTTTGAPEAPPSGYARIFIAEYEGVLHLQMIRPDGSIEIFGTLNTPLDVNRGGTGLATIPQIGQFLIGTGTGYRVGDIVAGDGVSIVSDETKFEISTNISNITLDMPSEFLVEKSLVDGQNTFTVTKEAQQAKTVYAGPLSGQEDATPTFRFIQVEDLPDLPISKITDLIETIRRESLLVPTSTDSIEHVYDNTTKILTSNLKATTVVAGSYGEHQKTLSLTVNSEGRLTEVLESDIQIETSQITEFSENVQDVVGALVASTDSITPEYNDYDNTLKFDVNSEFLITTNISNTENTRAPTSQAIKTYVDEQITGERGLRTTAISEERVAREQDVQKIRQDTGISGETTYSGHIESNYIKPEDFEANELEKNLNNADFLLDKAIKDSKLSLDSRIDKVRNASGLESTDEYAANPDSTYLKQAISLKDADNILDVTLKTESDNRVAGDTASRAYTDEKVLAIIDNAINNLNTLNKLGLALGNDHQFSTTIRSEISEVSGKVTENSGLIQDIQESITTINGDGPGSISKAKQDAFEYVHTKIADALGSVNSGSMLEQIYRVSEIINDTNLDTGILGIIDTIRISASTSSNEIVSLKNFTGSAYNVSFNSQVENTFYIASKLTVLEALIKLDETLKDTRDTDLQRHNGLSSLITAMLSELNLDLSGNWETLTSSNYLTQQYDLKSCLLTLDSIAKQLWDREQGDPVSVSNIIGGVGLNGDGTFTALTSSNYVQSSATIVQAITALDTVLKSGLDSKIPLSQKGTANGVATLGSDSKIPVEQIPFGESPIVSVNGKQGEVTLNSGDILEGTNLYFTNDRAKVATVVNSTQGTETDLAPSVQAVKSYLSTQLLPLTQADADLKDRLDTFFEGSSQQLNTLLEIEARINSIDGGNTTTAQDLTAFKENIETKINANLASLQALIGVEADTRVSEINRVYNSVQAKKELINLTPQSINGPIVLQNVSRVEDIMADSIVGFVDRLGLFEELDFDLSNYGENQVALTFTPDILTILDGTEVLRLKYLVRV